MLTSDATQKVTPPGFFSMIILNSKRITHCKWGLQSLISKRWAADLNSNDFLISSKIRKCKKSTFVLFKEEFKVLSL